MQNRAFLIQISQDRIYEISKLAWSRALTGLNPSLRRGSGIGRARKRARADRKTRSFVNSRVREASGTRISVDVPPRRLYELKEPAARRAVHSMESGECAHIHTREQERERGGGGGAEGEGNRARSRLPFSLAVSWLRLHGRWFIFARGASSGGGARNPVNPTWHRRDGCAG